MKVYEQDNTVILEDIKDFNPENVTVNIISSETKNSINK